MRGSSISSSSSSSTSWYHGQGQRPLHRPDRCGDAERYDINYIDESGARRRPILLHCSLSGAIERVMYAILEKAARLSLQGKLPMLETWLSPTQVRIIPVAERHQERALAWPGFSASAQILTTGTRPWQEDPRCWKGMGAICGSDRGRGAPVRSVAVTIRSESTPKSRQRRA